MSSIKDCSDSSRRYLLPDRLPEIFDTNPVQLKIINHDAKSYFQPDFFYSGAALLSPEGKRLALESKIQMGKCLGGGVMASLDLEWLGAGKRGSQPGAFTPRRRLVGIDKEPQSHLPSEWITFEYGVILRPPYGDFLVNSWDEINSMVTTTRQGRDLHIRIDGRFAGGVTQINGQANAMGMTTLLTIAGFAGVPIFS